MPVMSISQSEGAVQTASMKCSCSKMPLLTPVPLELPVAANKLNEWFNANGRTDAVVLFSHGSGGIDRTGDEELGL